MPQNRFTAVGRVARNRSPDHYYRTLFTSLLTPICSPELMKGPNALKTPEDLKKHKLLYVYTAEEDWHLWLEEAGVEGIRLSDRLAFDSYILAQEAAIEHVRAVLVAVRR